MTYKHDLFVGLSSLSLEAPFCMLVEASGSVLKMGEGIQIFQWIYFFYALLLTAQLWVVICKMALLYSPAQC